MQYTQNEENVMNIIVSALYTTGWVGIGFSRDGMMVGSSAMVGWVNKKGHARIHQYYLQGRKQSEVIQDKGELPLTNVPSSVVLHGATIYLAFQLKFSATVSQQPILLAFGNAYPRHHHLSTHSDKTAVVFDFSAGFFCCRHQFSLLTICFNTLKIFLYCSLTQALSLQQQQQAVRLVKQRRTTV